MEKEEDEEVEEEEEEDEGALQVNCLQARRSGVASLFGPDLKIMKSVLCLSDPGIPGVRSMGPSVSN